MSDIEQVVEPYDGIKFIKHSDDTSWRFDYGGQKNIFRNIDDDISNEVFVRSTDEKIQKGTDLTEADLEDFRRAASIHKIVRRDARKYLYHGGKLADLVDGVEAMILILTKQDPSTYYSKGSANGNDAGIAFPVGININNVVAHDSKTMVIEDTRTFSLGDVVKVDIGVHVRGRIIDSAFTHIVSSTKGVTDRQSIYTPVLEASRDSVFSTIKLAGPDQMLYELSENIQEIIKSYEIELPKTIVPIRPVTGIGGHNILKHKIHGGKLVLCVPDEDLQGELRMKEDEIYAIETYATTGMGQTTQNDSMASCTHFMEVDKESVCANKEITKNNKKLFQRMPLYDWLQTRNGLPFSSTWLYNKNQNSKIVDKTIDKLDKAFKLGISTCQIAAYPPLNDESGSVVAQFEHTIHIGPRTTEIFSLGDDY